MAVRSKQNAAAAAVVAAATTATATADGGLIRYNVERAREVQKYRALLNKQLSPPTIDLYLHVYNPFEEEKAGQRQYIELFSEHRSVQPGKVLRYLRSCAFCFQTTHTLLTEHLIWNEKRRPNTITLLDVDARALNSGCWRYLGLNANGLPVLWVQVDKWNPFDYSINAYEVYVSYFLSMLERQMTTATQEIILFDMAGWSFWQGQYLRYVHCLVNIVQNQYAERLVRHSSLVIILLFL